VAANFTIADHRQYLFYLVIRTSDALCGSSASSSVARGLVKTRGLDRTKSACYNVVINLKSFGFTVDGNSLKTKYTLSFTFHRNVKVFILIMAFVYFRYSAKKGIS